MPPEAFTIQHVSPLLEQKNASYWSLEISIEAFVHVNHDTTIQVGVQVANFRTKRTATIKAARGVAHCVVMFEIPDNGAIQRWLKTSVIHLLLFVKLVNVGVTWNRWPRGYGIPNLYDLAIEISSPTTSRAQVFKKKIGFRNVTLHADPLEDGESFYFAVNGVPVYLKGANLVPMDVFHNQSASDGTIYNIFQLF